MNDDMKSMFIYMIIPINYKYKPFIVHMHPHKNGQANEEILNNIKSIKEKFNNTIFDIKYISCDGDSFYEHSFDTQFDAFINNYNEENPTQLFELIKELDLIWISDPLHLWKNGRTRLLFNQIVINPFDDSSSITVEKLDKILETGPILNDKSSIGKMRDGYATSLFTFINSLKMIENGDVASFIYILIFALWNEAILNPHIKPQTREYLLLVLLHILITIYRKQLEGLPDNVGFKKSEEKPFVTMFSQAKLKRWIPTVVVLALEIADGNLDTGLERIGSHCIEEMIGIIRVFCKFDHRIEKILRSAASFQIIRDISNDLFPKKAKRTRLNSGGCKLFNGDKEFDFNASFLQIADTILGLIGYTEPHNDEDVDEFITNLIIFVEQAPYPQTSLPSNNSNRSILDRYHSQKPPANDFHPQKQQRFKWNPEDDFVFDSYLLQSKEKELFSIYKNRKKRSIRLKIHERKVALSKRPLDNSEVQLIDRCIFNNIPPISIVQFLKFRPLNVVQDLISFRYQYLQSTGFIQPVLRM